MAQKSKYFSAHVDVWSHGQVKSKLWLCEKLEKALTGVDSQKHWTIWIYGGWYSMTAFLLLSRMNLLIDHIRGMDVDPVASEAADIMNDKWVYESWRFKSFVKDCNDVHFDVDSEIMRSQAPDLVINTACEHFTSTQWWESLPVGQYVALQSNNMVHEEHANLCSSLGEFVDRHPMRETFFQGVLPFSYREDFKFDRFMLIGRK